MHKDRYLSYDEYVANRSKGRVRAIFEKMALAVNSYWNFSWRFRNVVYRLLGMDIASAASGTYIAREVLFDDNFPELIRIEEGAVLSGPAPRNLGWFRVEQSAGGKIVVDPGHSVSHDRGM